MATWGLGTVVTAAAWWWLAAPALAAVRTGSFEQLVGAVAALVLAGCLVWLWLVATIALGGAALGLDLSRVGAWAGPPVVRRLVLAACGLALAGTTAPAVATPLGPVTGPGSADRASAAPWSAQATADTVAPVAVAVAGLPRVPTGVRALSGLPLPERPATPRHPTPDRPPALAGGDIVVRAGDSLWSLAAGRLPSTAGDHLVDLGWRALYRANSAAIGPDPDLVHPGLRLHVPALPHLEETP